tara:strand:- start:291 stop:482 length:192 start_codon:yes stop_codon:yes gene_type:complete
MKFASLRTVTKVNVSEFFGPVEFNEHRCVPRTIITVSVAKTIGPRGRFDLDDRSSGSGEKLGT